VVPGERLAPDFVRDVRLVFQNAMQYNNAGSEYHEHAREMLAWVATKTATLENDGTQATSKTDKKPKKPTKDKRQSTEASMAQIAGFKRLWEKQIDLLQELPKTKQSVDKGGPAPLVGVRALNPNPHYPKGRDLREMGLGGGDDEDDDGGEDNTGDKSDRRKGGGETRCLWAVPDGRIFVEAWGLKFKRVEDFLVAIAEPEARPLHIHEFQMTEHSLYAAASMGYGTKQIIEQLKAWSKVEIPESLEAWIKNKTGKYGKVKLVLRENEHHVETADIRVMKRLLLDKRVKDCMIKQKNDMGVVAGDAAVLVQKSTIELLEKQFDEFADDENVDDVVWDGMDTDVNVKQSKKKKKKKTREVEHFAIAPGKYRDIKKACNEIGYPIIEEYDYKNDKKPLKGASARRVDKSRTGLELKSADYVRDYQAKCLNKMFGSNGRARSGLIVLPCGAGKSFVGVTAACTVNKKTMVLCPTGLSVDQWKFQFENWTNCLSAGVRVEGFTSTSLREKSEDEVRTMMKADVIITTYSALTAGREGQRAQTREVMLRELENEHEFGLMILDEVHMLPAAEFQKSLDKLKAHCKLGLTATLVREDEKINDLRFLIGPKIYEANWMELQKAGYLAKVQCHEVQCPMAADFYSAYLAAGHKKPTGAASAAAHQGGTIFHKEQMLYIMNPNKLMAAHHLILKHKKLGHKIIIFSDRIFPLAVLSKALDRLDQKLPIGHPERLGAGRIDGSCEAWERQKLMDSFKNNADDHVILLSKVGDAALDMPDANVIIQIASSGASRMQEAQRLGRILRPKSTMARGSEPQAFFYSLVSQDTHEMRFSTARQRYLVEQGYAFHVHPPDDTGICGEAERECQALKRAGKPPLLFSAREEQRRLLADIEDADENGLNLGEDEDKEGKLKEAEKDQKWLKDHKSKGRPQLGNNAAIHRMVTSGQRR
jgi:DNA excision repair protein ERCC-3